MFSLVFTAHENVLFIVCEFLLLVSNFSIALAFLFSFLFLSPLYLAAWSHAGNSLSLYLPACWDGFSHILSFPFPLFGSACLFVPVNVVYPFYLFLFFATVLFSLRVSQSQRLERLYNSRYFLMTWRACSLDSCDMEFYV